MSIDQRPEQPFQPHDPFKVSILGDSQWLYTVAQGLLHIDLVKDRRFKSVHLSKTQFHPHAIVSSELTWMGGHVVDGNKQYNINSVVVLSEEYLDKNNAGYISDEKVDGIADRLRQQLPRLTIDKVVHPLTENHIFIRNQNMVIETNLGFSNPDVERAERERREEIMKEVSHPEGKYYKEFEELFASRKKIPETEEVREFTETVRSLMIEKVGTTPILPDNRHTTFQLKLIDANARGLDALSVPLQSSEEFRTNLDFYASGYSAIINALCAVEGVPSPKPRILLGSALLE